MKYSFVKKAKVPDAGQIKSSMNFAKVAANSKAFVGVKIASSVLKGATAVKSVVVSSVSVAVIATSTYVVYPELFSLDKEEPQAPQQEQIDLEPVLDTLSTQEVEEPDTIAQAAPAKTTQVKAKVDTPKKVKEATTSQPLLIYEEDVVIEAHPLPNKESFLKHINSKLNYPMEHLGDSIQGYVKVRFKVNKKGETEDFKISKSLGEAFDNEAIRVIKAYEQWQPATYNGEAVDSYLHLQVTFQIK